MSGATSGWVIPYPTGGDPARDGDNKIAELAARIDYLLSLTVVAPPLGYTAIAPQGWAGSAGFFVRNHVVHVTYGLTRANWASHSTMFTVPAPYRPGIQLPSMAVTTSSGKAFTCTLNTNGVATVFTPGGSTDGGIMGYWTFPMP